MISMVSARRRAEEFASLVDAGHGRAEESSYADLLELVSEMRAVPAPAPRPQFVTSLRERLMAEADTALVPTESRRLELTPPPVRRRDRRVAVAVGAAALLGASTSVAMASQSALPGDSLYPVKRALESAETSFEAGDAAKAASMFDRASTRLEELGSLARDDAGTATMSDTLADFITHSEQGADLLFGSYDADPDPARMLELRDFATRSLEQLAELKPLLPAELQPLVDEAVATLLSFDARAVDSCPSCGGPIDLPVSLVAARHDATVPVPPSLAPPATLLPEDDTSSSSTEDPIRALLSGLPVLGTSLPDVSPDQTDGGAQGDAGGIDGGGNNLVEDSLEPLETTTDPLLGEEGLVAGSEALDGLLSGLTDPLLSDDTATDDTPDTGDLLQ